MMIELFNEIWATSRRNKLRTALTGFAVAWGIFMLIVLLGAGNGLINATMKSAENTSTNSMTVFGGFTEKPYNGMKEGRRIRLNQRDATLTAHHAKDNIEEIGSVYEVSSVSIRLGGNYVASQELDGVSPLYADIHKVRLLAGRFVNEADMRGRRKVIVLSTSQAKELAPDPASLVGKEVTVGQLGYQVVGVAKDDNSQQNNEAFIPSATMRDIYAKGDDVDNMEIALRGVNTLAQSEDVEARVRHAVNASHRAAPDDQGSVWIWNHFENNVEMLQATAIIRTALWIVGLFTLLSGVVGVSNIMLITVKERTREFGVRKAIGAKPRDILRLIIAESVIITTLFGYIGMVLGIAANAWLDATLGHEVTDVGLFKVSVFVKPGVGFDTCVEALAVMVLAGVVAGLVPALKAARVRPIEALRN